MSNLHDERRRFFRVNDKISLSYTLVDAQSATSSPFQLANSRTGSYSLAATLNELSQESRQLILRMENQHPELMELVKIMDAKINAIAQEVMIRNSVINTDASREVNLSATGLAFHDSTGIPEGQHLKIQMFLPIVMSIVEAYGKVVHCKTIQSDDYLIRIEFIRIKEEDQELLIQQIVRAQWLQHRHAAGKA